MSLVRICDSSFRLGYDCREDDIHESNVKVRRTSPVISDAKSFVAGISDFSESKSGRVYSFSGLRGR